MPDPRQNPVVVFDAFGTLLKIDNPTKPFGLLADYLKQQGVNVSGFAIRAMTAPHTPSSLAASYGVSVPMDVLAHVDAHLLEELGRIEPYPDADRALRHALSRGASVVIASNLAWPYAMPVVAMLKHMIGNQAMGPGARLSTFFSFDRGLLKPDPRFYHKLVQSLPPSPAKPEMFMVGDKIVEDANAPIQAGWSAWHLDRGAGASLLDAPWDEWLSRRHV